MLQIGDASVVSIRKVCDLCVMLDEHMTMDGHVGKACRSAYAQLSTIVRIRGLLVPEGQRLLVQALVTARLDYCNCKEEFAKYMLFATQINHIHLRHEPLSTVDSKQSVNIEEPP